MKKWKRKMGSGVIILAILMMLLGSNGIFIPLTTASDYYHKRFVDGEYTSSYTTADRRGTARLPYAVKRNTNTYNGEIDIVAALIPGYGEAYVKGVMNTSFTYDGDSGNNFIELCYAVIGCASGIETLKFLGGEGWEFKIKVELWGYSGDEKIRLKEEVSLKQEGQLKYGTYSYWEISQYRTVKFEKYLENGQSYDILLIAEIRAHAWGIGTATVDFHTEQNEIDLQYVRVYHTGNTVNIVIDDLHNYPVYGQYSLKQKDFPSGADELRFKSKNYDSDVNGWDVTVSDFKSIDGDRIDERVAQIIVFDEVIPQDFSVEVSVRQYMDEENGMCLRDVKWTPVETSEENDRTLIPDYSWHLDYPIPNWLGGGYSHLFSLTNTDSNQTLVISGLTFLATDTEYYDDKNMTQINFPGEDVYDIVLSPGQSWIQRIITETALYGGHIYFKHSVHGFNGTDVVCNAWGGHPVYLLTETPIDVDVEITDAVINHYPTEGYTRAQLYGLQQNSITPHHVMIAPMNQIYYFSINITVSYTGTEPRLIGIGFGTEAYPHTIDSEMFWMSNGVTVTAEFWWDGKNCPTGVYDIFAVAGPVSSDANEIVSANNYMDLGYMNVSFFEGDINGDSYVELTDFFLASQAFGSEPYFNRWNPFADLNEDNFVELIDFFILSANFGRNFWT